MHTQRAETATRLERLTSTGSVLVALLATQHHSLHMLLLVGLSGVGTSAIGTAPTLRRAMLLLALVMAGVTAYRLIRHRPSRYQQVINLLGVQARVVRGW